MLRRAYSAVFGLVLSLFARVALSCPTCSDNLAKDVYGQNPTSLGRGFFWSIILMVSLPFVVSAVVAARILVARRRQTHASAGELMASPESP